MTHIRDAWYVAGWSRDLAVAQPSALSILGDPIVSLGRCEGERLRCMYHGLNSPAVTAWQSKV